jgi:methylthioribose-1-phosphate isomerase
VSAPWRAVDWDGSAVLLLDQRRLPTEEVVLRLEDVEAVARAIEDMVVRGAPAIGCTAALGVALAAADAPVRDAAGVRDAALAAASRLARTRPTAVNLFFALDRMREEAARAASAPGADAGSVRAALTARARALVEEDRAACRALGHAGLELVPDGARILTHCNAGGLATAGYGTALGVVRAAVEAGRAVTVLASETRPFLQGARLTAWELARDGIPVTVVTDNTVGALMRAGEIDLVVVGADRIAANGDVANKIGTYAVAQLARAHGIPFAVAAPTSTIDPETPTGDAIPIEERGRDEVALVGGRPVVPEGVPVRHLAFDVTPATLVDAIVTERGVARPPYEASLAGLLRAGCASPAGV